MYGDYLQAQGDPRGELVALDLLGGGSDVIARKNELLVAWIGEALLARILAAGAIECGFVELYVEDNPQLLVDVLASPAGAFLRTLTIRGRSSSLHRMATALVAAPRPWLAKLAIAQTDVTRSPPTLPRAIADRFADALPRLDTLDVTGHGILARIELPQLRTLRVTGHDAIGSLGGDGAVLLANVTAIDLAFGVPGTQRTATHDVLDALLPPARFPRLARLDLSRNEPGAFPPHNLGLGVDPFTWLGQREIRAQLTDVAVPSVRSEAQSETLGQAIATMPALRRIEQARRYALRDARFPVPPTVERVVGWPRPWLPADELGEATFEIIVRPDQPPDLCFGQPIASWLDQHATRLSEHVLAAWGHVFGFLDRLALRVPQAFPAVVLDTALATLGEGMGLAGWLRVRFLLRRPGVQLPSLSVAIQRLA